MKTVDAEERAYVSDDMTTFTISSFLSAAECNAQCEMSLPLLVQRIIDVATGHANALGVGYANLLEENNAWVLSRLSIEMERFPAINERYSLTTWVESFNRHFSERNIMISDADGNPIGYARTIWVAINIATRRPADLSGFVDRIHPTDLPCPIAKLPRMPRIDNPDKVARHTFQFCDIDFNRHVNSTRYVEFMLNQWGVEFFDRNRVGRFDITYVAETHFEDTVEVRIKSDGDAQDIEITRDGNVCTRARLKFVARK